MRQIFREAPPGDPAGSKRYAFHRALSNRIRAGERASGDGYVPVDDAAVTAAGPQLSIDADTGAKNGMHAVEVRAEPTRGGWTSDRQIEDSLAQAVAIGDDAAT